MSKHVTFVFLWPGKYIGECTKRMTKVSTINAQEKSTFFGLCLYYWNIMWSTDWWQNMLVTNTQRHKYPHVRMHTLTFLSEPEQQTDQQRERDEPLGWEDVRVPHPHSTSLLGKPFCIWSVLIALISLLHCGVMTFIAKTRRVIRYNPPVCVIIRGQ